MGMTEQEWNALPLDHPARIKRNEQIRRRSDREFVQLPDCSDQLRALDQQRAWEREERRLERETDVDRILARLARAEECIATLQRSNAEIADRLRALTEKGKNECQTTPAVKTTTASSPPSANPATPVSATPPRAASTTAPSAPQPKDTGSSAQPKPSGPPASKLSETQPKPSDAPKPSERVSASSSQPKTDDAKKSSSPQPTLSSSPKPSRA